MNLPQNWANLVIGLTKSTYNSGKETHLQNIGKIGEQLRFVTYPFFFYQIRLHVKIEVQTAFSLWKRGHVAKGGKMKQSGKGQIGPLQKYLQVQLVNYIFDIFISKKFVLNWNKSQSEHKVLSFWSSNWPIITIF